MDDGQEVALAGGVPLEALPMLQEPAQTMGRRGRRRIAAKLAGAVVAFGAGAAGMAVVLGLRGGGPLTAKTLEPVEELFERPMPSKASTYDGVEDTRKFVIDTKKDVVHVFAVGDWGALLPNHQTAGCKHGWDCNAQFQVANAMRARAKWAHPEYIVNVGDNFYYAGLPDDNCNSPPGAAWKTAQRAFQTGWMYMYGELSQKYWISCLGNHDYGGWQMNNGWPQQIGYSFVNRYWIMPARYYNRRVQHKDFVMEYFVIDSNVFDAKDPHIAEHNICSQQHNPPGASCAANDGMQNIWSCPSWFEGSYKWQQRWLEKKLQESTADWRVVVTHFPCGYDGSWYRGLHEKHGLDLLITGHRHQQELWWKGTTSKYLQDFISKTDLGDLPCFVTGGGGGISAEWLANADYGRDLQLYGFFDLTVAKDWMNIELVDTRNWVMGNMTIHPSHKRTIPAPVATPFAQKPPLFAENPSVKESPPWARWSESWEPHHAVKPPPWDA